MVIIDISAKGITLFSGSMEMGYTCEEFEKIIEKFREVDSNDLIVSIGYGLKDNLFHYDKGNKGQEVSFEQRGHYITISKENARSLFEYYETEINKPPIHAPKNQELKFTREEWNNFYNEWSLS